MKYLKRFNESNQYLETIRKNCEDILLIFPDNDFRCKIQSIDNVRHRFDLKEQIFIEIGDYNKIIMLNDFDSELNHLLDYLEDEGFKLSDYMSFVTNHNWEPAIVCPQCGAKDKVSNYQDSETGDDSYFCNECGYDTDYEHFTTPQHTIDEGELKYMIKDNYYVEFISMLFERIK